LVVMATFVHSWMATRESRCSTLKRAACGYSLISRSEVKRVGFCMLCAASAAWLGLGLG